MAFDAHANLAISHVAVAPSPATSGTSLTVTAGHGSRFPATPFQATIWRDEELPSPTNAEIVRVTAVAGDTLTITRAQEGTTARTVIVGDRIANTMTVKAFTDIETAAPNAHAASHQDGGADEINVAGLSGLLATPQTPAAHAHDGVDITTGLVAPARLGINHDVSLFLKGDQTWATPPAGKVELARQTADQSTTSNAFQTVTGLQFFITTGVNSSFEFVVFYTTAATGTALQLSVLGVLGPAAELRYSVETCTSATARHVAVQTAYDTVTNPATGGGATPLMAIVRGTVLDAANNDFLVLRFRSEINGNTVTILRGSYGVHYKHT